MATSSPPPPTYVLLLPLAEVDLEGGHGELLAHAPLVVNRFGDQGGVLWAVAAGLWGGGGGIENKKKITKFIKKNEGLNHINRFAPLIHGPVPTGSPTTQN